ncbi:hypothetical protein BDR03DRAFT_984673 [Suillus americanus]|nr:hypothetical protein BDR03DRAFT_984673 [Suillus americanus]
MDDNYHELVEATFNLAHDDMELSSSKQMDHNDWPSWAKWSWKHGYLPKDIHESWKALEASLNNLRKANISNSTQAVSAVLGLGMLFRECGCAIEYEEDEASLDTPAYLANSVFNISVLDLLGHAVADVLGSVIEEGGSAEVEQVKVLVDVQDIKMGQEEEKESEVEVEEDKDEEVVVEEEPEEDKEEEEEEEEEADEAEVEVEEVVVVVVEVKQTRGKRSRTQLPSRHSKRAKTEPKLSSIKSKKPVKAEI